MAQRQYFVALWLVLCAIGTVYLASAEPSAPTTLTQGASTTMNVGNYLPVSVTASAGNITDLVIFGISQTRSWQGYYGNVTGTVTLDDINNFTFYNWSAAEPRGQIYATLANSVAWANVVCYDFVGAGDNWVTIENYYNISTDSVDGVNETFNLTSHPLFDVGFNSMSGCPTTYVFQNDQRQEENFVNVLLYDPGTPGTGWIYTSLIENKTLGQQNDLICYHGGECDFQILVNENGHGTDVAPTTYYFWVELL